MAGLAHSGAQKPERRRDVTRELLQEPFGERRAARRHMTEEHNRVGSLERRAQRHLVAEVRVASGEADVARRDKGRRVAAFAGVRADDRHMHPRSNHSRQQMGADEVAAAGHHDTHRRLAVATRGHRGDVDHQ